MDTGVLRGFAGSARVSLLAGVAARVGVVLAAGSDARAVVPELVAGLEREIAAAGGGEAGRKAVVDRVAYTWFNRITALRFMDAAGITTMRVVSPVPGGVQPEVLTAAKQGVFEDAVPVRDRERVTGFLTGALASPNPDRDAYGVLLAAYCRWWNQTMPFLFEKTADYTELLIPQDLLLDDSVRDKAVKTLTAEVCEDVEVIGWLYQFYIADRKDEVFAGFKKGKKAGAAEIPAATQLFTPHWIVRYLVENSLGRLWLLNHPDSTLRQQMEYYIDPVDEETDFLKIGSPEEIKVIDPACGSGHMLTYAFDLLYAIYEEEGYPPSDIPALILQNNLFGTEIDERAGTLAAFALTMKARLKQKTFLTKKVTPNICVLRNVVFTPDELDQLRHPAHHRTDEDTFWNLFEHADLFGSLVTPNQTVLSTAQSVVDGLPADDLLSDNLKTRAQTVADQATYLSQRYHVVVANPPYMGSKNIGPSLATFIDRNAAGLGADLFAAFVARMLTLVPRGGLAAFVAPNVWFYLKGHATLRSEIVNGNRLLSAVELPLGGMPGATVQVAAAALARGAGRSKTTFIRLVESSERGSALGQAMLDVLRPSSGSAVHVVSPGDFSVIPGSPLAYWATPDVLDAFASHAPLTSKLTARVAMATGDNDAFVRSWSEVSRSRIATDTSNSSEAVASQKRWFPVNRGGEFRKWYGNREYVVDWENDGERVRSFKDSATGRIRSHNYNGAFAFREGLTWGALNSSNFGVRYAATGSLFMTPGSSAFTSGGGSPHALVGYLNTSVAKRLLGLVSSTMNIEVGDVLRLPLPELSADFDRLARASIELSLEDWNALEISMEFQASPLVHAAHSGELKLAVSRLYAVEDLRRAELLRVERLLDELALASLGLAPTESDLEAFKVTLANLGTGGPPAAAILALLSYGVGNLFGRYSLDGPGLILADQGDSFDTFLERVPGARFLPDRDNVIPIVDGDWFEDDIVARFRQWLRVAFGAEHLQENWQYIEDTLGKSIRQYFVKDFYLDHVKRYRKRPIYWLFSSPKGTFNALVYLHRYTPSTAGTVLHDYVLPFLTKLDTELAKQEHLTVIDDTPRAKAAAIKQAEVLRKQIVEVRDWATNTLQPLADTQLVIDLDDGVKHNYRLLGAALKKIPGLDTTQ